MRKLFIAQILWLFCPVTASKFVILECWLLVLWTTIGGMDEQVLTV